MPPSLGLIASMRRRPSGVRRRAARASSCATGQPIPSAPPFALVKNTNGTLGIARDQSEAPVRRSRPSRPTTVRTARGSRRTASIASPTWSNCVSAGSVRCSTPLPRTRSSRAIPRPALSDGGKSAYRSPASSITPPRNPRTCIARFPVPRFQAAPRRRPVTASQANRGSPPRHAGSRAASAAARPRPAARCHFRSIGARPAGRRAPR